MADDVVIRRLSAENVDLFRSIRLEALHCEPDSFASVYDDWINLSDEEWRQHLQQPVFVAFRGGQPLGLMGLKFECARRIAHRAKLVSVFVRKDARGSGIAAKLMIEVIACAQKRGVSQLELTVTDGNYAAINFYRSQGFSEVGRIPDGFCDRDIKSDEIIMVLQLANKSIELGLQ